MHGFLAPVVVHIGDKVKFHILPDWITSEGQLVGRKIMIHMLISYTYFIYVFGR